MEPSNRVDFIDLAKGVGISLMIVCHAGLHNAVTQWIYAFHMPLFFFVSGLLVKDVKGSFFDYSIKKMRQLIVPYILFSTILCFGTNHYKDWFYLIYASRTSLSLAHSFTPLWFLPCFFLSTIIYALLKRQFHDFAHTVVVLVVGVSGFFLSRICKPEIGLPWNFDMALVALLFILFSDNFMRHLKFGALGGGKILLLMTCGTIGCYLNLPESLTEGNPHVEMAIGSLGFEPLFIVNALLLCTGMLGLCKLSMQSHIQNLLKPLLWIGRNSLSIMCIHGVLLIPFVVAGNRILPNSTVLTPVLSTIAVLCVCYPTIYFIKLFVPNMIGIVDNPKSINKI